MKLDKAIETQQTYFKGDEAVEHQDLIDAMKLGTEAMKAVRDMRHYPFPESILLLPGETKE